jgi:mRNA interferase MazF
MIASMSPTRSRCVFATDSTEAPLIRLPVSPDEENGLHERCSLMVDKITTMPGAKVRTRIGRLSDQDMARLGRAAVVFLGLAGN